MIEIPKDIIDEILSQAYAEIPNEACGYLAGKDGRAKMRVQMTNVDSSPEHFSFDPAEQFEAIKTARGKGLELMAVYHSHPETPARMSLEDIRLASDPKIAYVITSLADKQTKAFHVNEEKAVREITLKTV